MTHSSSDRDLFYIYAILRHPVRRKIVEILGDLGAASFTDLRLRTNLRVGTLYYHFDTLKGFIAQDKNRRYLLTDLGKNAYSLLSSKDYVAGSHLVQKRLRQYGVLERIGSILLMKGILTWIPSRLPVALTLAALLLALGSFLVVQSRLETLLLLFNQTRIPSFLTVIKFLASWLGLYAIADLLTGILYKRPGEHLALLTGAVISLWPMLLFPVWWYLTTVLSLIPFLPLTLNVSRILVIVLQAWSLSILAQALSILKGVRIEKAALVSLLIAYVNIALIFVLGF